MEKEIWKPIKGFEGSYEVSNYGNVRSLDRMVKCLNGYEHRNGKMLKPHKNKKGYMSVSLGKNNQKLVHRLVAEAFVPNPDNLPIINHIDENPSNNFSSNLEWCDYSYNNSYGDGNVQRTETKKKTWAEKKAKMWPYSIYDNKTKRFKL